jgi:putative transposase
VRGWLGRVGVKTLFIEPGSPWENGYVESFNGKLRDELLDREAFDTLLEAKVLIERWRVRYNTVRPHSSLGYRPPAPEAVATWTPALGAPLLGPAAMAGTVEKLT